MMLTRRDLDIISFLEDYKIASTSTLTTFFFPSKRSCQMRLKTLADYKYIKRARMTMNHDYIYYIKKPYKVTHDLLITEFYRELKLSSNIISFVVEKQIGKIRPDAIFAFENRTQKLGLLEVEISNKGFDYEKFETFYRSGIYKEYFPMMPTVYVIGNKTKLPNNPLVNYKTINISLSDFRL